MANSPATLTLPESYFDLVRPGGAVVGLCTLPGGAPDWLRPAMTLRARLIQVKRVPADAGVSYAHRYVDRAATPRSACCRSATTRASRGTRPTRAGCSSGGSRFKIAGHRQHEPDHPGSRRRAGRGGRRGRVFGPGDRGEPTAQEWADLLGTLSYEIVTRFTGKVPRTYSGVTAAEDDASQAGDQADRSAADGRTDGQVAAAL